MVVRPDIPFLFCTYLRGVGPLQFLLFLYFFRPRARSSLSFFSAIVGTPRSTSRQRFMTPNSSCLSRLSFRVNHRGNVGTRVHRSSHLPCNIIEYSYPVVHRETGMFPSTAFMQIHIFKGRGAVLEIVGKKKISRFSHQR